MRIDWIKISEYVEQGREIQDKSRREFSPTAKQMYRTAEQEIVQMIKDEFKKDKPNA